MLHGTRMLFMIGAIALNVACAYSAGNTFKAGDVVAFFEEQKAMQTTRGICVGSDDECAMADIKDHSSAFDLLINFDKASAELTEDARQNLIEFSVALRNPKLASLHFAVDGFTDATGEDDYNLELSKRRAASVVAFLQSMGVNDGMLLPRGWGETNFRMTDATDPANRRVETRLIKSK